MPDTRVVGYRFLAAPGWEPAPDGWTPPDGWLPPAHWPPAPPGWNFWEPIEQPVPDPAPPVPGISPIAGAAPRALSTELVEAVAPAPPMSAPVPPQESAVPVLVPQPPLPQSAPPPAPPAPVTPTPVVAAREFIPLPPLEERVIPAVGRKAFIALVLQERQELHAIAAHLTRELHERDLLLDRFEIMPIVEREELAEQLSRDVDSWTAELDAVRAEVERTRRRLDDAKAELEDLRAQLGRRPSSPQVA